jgi:D-alanyl-D-alanine carboxypeptidase/D-alanyl-D-alanine-endopeptidase (penicillin-binding protein 4)
MLVLCMLGVLVTPATLTGVAAATPTSSTLITRPQPRAKPVWVRKIDKLVAGKNVSVQIEVGDEILYRNRPRVQRPPASNEKLLLSMALLDRFAPSTRLPVRIRATAEPTVKGTIHGKLWLIGTGNPETGVAELKELAGMLQDLGVQRITGGIAASTGPFARDHWAPGWKSYFPSTYIALPTALTFRANEDGRGRHINDPERRAATAFTKILRRRGIQVEHAPRTGTPSKALVTLATARGPRLRAIIRRMNVASRNFSAEVLGKYLGGRAAGGPGTIAKGARAIQRFAKARGVTIIAHDASGLSYANRASPLGIVSLLAHAEQRSWGTVLRSTLPTGGQGTLAGRLTQVKVRAKTGSLTAVSALSGWVRLDHGGAWARFSILDQGMSKADAVTIEDAIVRLTARRAKPRA